MKMRTRQTLFHATWILAAWHVPAAAQSKPNIIYIMAG